VGTLFFSQMDDERIRFAGTNLLVGVGALSFLQYADTVCLMTGRASGP